MTTDMMEASTDAGVCIDGGSLVIARPEAADDFDMLE